MALHVRAHFDGRMIVLDEPVELPVNEPLDLRIETRPPVDKEIAPRLAALERAAGRAVAGVNLPDAAISRESIYDED